MHAVVYRSAVILCVCLNSVNGQPPTTRSALSPFAPGPAGLHDFSKLNSIQSAAARPNVLLATPGRTGYGGMAVHTETGQKFKIITKLGGKKTTAEPDGPDESDDNSMDVVEFHESLFNFLKRHLIDCLRIDNTDRTYSLSKFVGLISINQNLLNNSIALLLRHRVDIKPLTRLYLFFSGPFQAPDDSSEYRSHSVVGEFVIRHIQNDMKDKFKDIVGDAPLSMRVTVDRMQTLKENTVFELWCLATIAIYKLEPNGTGLMRGTPLHFTCIDLLKWTALMESDNEDAVRIQQMKIQVENTVISMRQYAERYRYEIDMDNLEELDLEVLSRINKTFLYYLYKHFALSTISIESKVSKSNPDNNLYAVSLAIEQTQGLRAFLEIFNRFFVARFLTYVDRGPTVQAKLTALISYMDRFGDNSEDTVREMQRSSETIVTDINHLITEFAQAFLPALKVDKPQKWIEGVNVDVAGTPDDISSALEENKNKALAIMALCLTQLNPDWPKLKRQNPIHFLRATIDASEDNDNDFW